MLIDTEKCNTNWAAPRLRPIKSHLITGSLMMSRSAAETWKRLWVILLLFLSLFLLWISLLSCSPNFINVRWRWMLSPNWDSHFKWSYLCLNYMLLTCGNKAQYLQPDKNRHCAIRYSLIFCLIMPFSLSVVELISTIIMHHHLADMCYCSSAFLSQIVQSVPLTHKAKARSGISRGRISWKQATAFCRILLKSLSASCREITDNERNRNCIFSCVFALGVF